MPCLELPLSLREPEHAADAMFLRRCRYAAATDAALRLPALIATLPLRFRQMIAADFR